MADVKKVLVVDDHFEMLELLRSMLELSNEEYEVLAVPSAEEGWLEMQRTPFDLVITDVRLPGMSGFDFVRRMRKRRRETSRWRACSASWRAALVSAGSAWSAPGLSWPPGAWSPTARAASW